jgi:hypothetical protein
MKKPDRPTNGVLLLILGGILLASVGMRFDGFVGGLLQGAGVGFILCGAWAFGALWRHGQDTDDTWLPSRDGDR